jgi:hypothetical protein
MVMVVKSWLYDTISPELQDVTRQHGHTARAAWLALENRFVQGKHTVNDYCLKMKGFTDSLINLGIDILDHVLVLNVLRGLNKAFDHLHAIFTHTTCFPSF